VVELFRKSQIPEPSSASPSPEETRLLKLLTEGRQNKTAAAVLGISIHTCARFTRSCACTSDRRQWRARCATGWWSDEVRASSPNVQRLGI